MLDFHSLVFRFYTFLLRFAEETQNMYHYLLCVTWENKELCQPLESLSDELIYYIHFFTGEPIVIFLSFTSLFDRLPLIKFYLTGMRMNFN